MFLPHSSLVPPANTGSVKDPCALCLSTFLHLTLTIKATDSPEGTGISYKIKMCYSLPDGILDSHLLQNISRLQDQNCWTNLHSYVKEINKSNKHCKKKIKSNQRTINLQLSLKILYPQQDYELLLLNHKTLPQQN